MAIWIVEFSKAWNNRTFFIYVPNWVQLWICNKKKLHIFDCLIATKRELTWEYKRPFDLYVNLFQIGTNCVLLHINSKPPQRTFLSAIWVCNGFIIFLKAIIFWEGHQNRAQSSSRFWCCYVVSKPWGMLHQIFVAFSENLNSDDFSSS